MNKQTSKLEVSLANASSSDMYSYLYEVINSGTYKNFDQQERVFIIDVVGNSASGDEQYRDKLIDMVIEVHDWATEAFNDGDKDYYPNPVFNFNYWIGLGYDN